MSKLEPLWDRVMILAPSVSDGGIHLPRSLKAQHDMGRGTVVGVGAAVRRVKVGWDVYFTRGERIDLVTHDGEDYWLLPEALVVARVGGERKDPEFFTCRHGANLEPPFWEGQSCGAGCTVGKGKDGEWGLFYAEPGRHLPAWVPTHPFEPCLDKAHSTIHCGHRNPFGGECGRPQAEHT